MTVVQQVITIGVVAVGTILTRFISFIVFPSGKQPPAIVTYLGGVLPYATMAFLVVLALRNVSPFTGSHGLPEAIACLSVVGMQVWKKNTLVSIAVGTVLYMVLIRTVFA